MTDRGGSGGAEPPAEIRTFLIADVRGYTLFTQERGDEAAAKLAGKFAELAREALEARGGAVIELRGDEALAVFASPRQAIRAALELQQRFAQETLEDPGLPLLVGIGLDAGEAVPMEGGFRGAALNLAARLCGQAGPGEVLASPEVVHLATALDGVRYVERGEVHLKGIAKPVRVIRVVPEGDDPAVALAPLAASRAAAIPAGRRRIRSWKWMAAAAVVVVSAGIIVPITLSGGGGVGPGATLAANSVGLIDPSTQRVVGQVAVGSRPVAMASGAGALWVANSGDGTVSRLDQESLHVVQTIPVGSGPAGIAVGFGSVWVTNSGARSVSEISPKTNAVVKTIPVGNGPIGIAVGHGSVWVTDSTDATVKEIDPLSGTVKRTIGVGDDPVSVAVGEDVWVSNGGDGTVTQLDPDSGEVIRSIPVGSGPKGLAIAPDGVWVANDLSGTVSRIDPSNGSVAETIPVGDGPTGIALEGRTLWVTNEFDGTVWQIEPGAPPHTLFLSNAPQAAVVTGAGLWVAAAGSGPAHRGGTLRLEATLNPDSIDTAIGYSDETWQILTITNDGLLTFERVNGPDGSTVVPDLATAVPRASDAGRTYTFQLRPGIRYSTGALVRASDVRRAIERVLRLGPASYLFQGIVGASTCTRNGCDLSSGVLVDDAGATVTFHLTVPDPDFLRKLALPVAAVVPPGTPNHRVTDPLPATGPYMIQSYHPAPKEGIGRLVLVRNPRFKEWSPAAQPDGYPDRIVWTFGVSPEQATRDVEAGRADWTQEAAPSLLNQLRTRFPDQLHVYPRPGVIGLMLNTRVAPFDDVRVRRAVNYAIDRGKIAAIWGDAVVTCQILPPNFSGYRPYCPYTVNPNGSGTWTAPDTATADRLMGESHARGTRVTVWTTSDPVVGRFVPIARYVVSLLDHLGLKADMKVIPNIDTYFGYIQDSRNHAQAGLTGWLPDYPSASTFLQSLFSCHSYLPADPNNPNSAGFCDRAVVDRLINRALSLQTTDPPLASDTWARADRAVVDRAPWAPLFNRAGIDFVSRRVANYQNSPQWFLLTDQLWIR